ncbi:MAG: PD-(D/E)XK nuclease family protein [Gammaproteobacteria bacterium]|nr:PD-(D/E)XK nuclease family protein [Gammaproteobacteria bacterium]
MAPAPSPDDDFPSLASPVDKLFKNLDQGVTVVTATQRLMHHLTARYAAYQQAMGKTVWESPDVIPWSAWVARSWAARTDRPTTAHDVALLLSDTQELALWEQVISTAAPINPRHSEFLSIHATSRAVRDAWRMLHGWRCTLKDCGQPLSEDAAAFVQWAKGFRMRCQDNGWLDQGLAIDVLTRNAQTQSEHSRRDIILVGFDQFTPQQQALIQALPVAGSQCTVMTPEVACADSIRVTASDADTQFELAARWARCLLECGHRGPIAMVVQGLEVVRACIRRKFDQIIQADPVLDLGSPVFQVSGGAPLSEVPMIAAALHLLRLASGKASSDEISAMLRSSFVSGWESEVQQRALLDQRLREYGTDRWRLRSVRNLAHRDSYDSRCPALVQALERALALLPQHAVALHSGAWARFFADWLKALGWPGEAPTDFERSQALRSWDALLSDFASLELVLTGSSLTTALGRLAHMASQRPFQPNMPTAPIQILAMSESAGLTFSHLWLAGVSDHVWPEAPRPTAFLPIWLQRERDMPHSSAANQLHHAQSVTGRLLGSANNAVVSTPMTEGDVGVRPSPLIAEMPEVEIATLSLSAVLTIKERLQLQRPTLTEMVDDRASCSIDAGVWPGGVGVFRDQAACPFRAFARHRLGVAGLEFPELGLDAAERGKLVHRVLEQVWRELRSQQALARYDETERKFLVQRHVVKALRAVNHDGSRFSRKFVELEQHRLTQLITEWLSHDLDRPGFEVESHESEALFNVGDLQVKIRPDRIDRLADGTRLIIDYKTGDAKIEHWFGERPQDPQLPIYMLSLGDDVAALAYGRVRRGDLGLYGLARARNVAPGLLGLDQTRATQVRDWAQLRSEWQRVVQQLAKDYGDGCAQVDPESPTVCRYCRLDPLCRVFETTTNTEDAADI